MSNPYTIKPVSRHARGMHRWMVIDEKRMVCVRFTVTRDEAERLARMMTLSKQLIQHERRTRQLQSHCS